MVHINKKKKEVSSETKNETFTSISTTQEQNNNIVSSSYDNNDEVRSTTATEIFDSIQNDNTSCDNQAITTQSFATNNPKSTKKSLNLGMWNWEAHTWNTSPKQFIAKIKSKGINQIYLQLEIENKTIKYIDQLNQLLDIAYKNRIKIIAIEGSPDMVIDSGLKNAIERNKIIKQFCSMRKNKPSLAGIQYDIEPYILDEYNQDANHIWKLWINAIKMLSQSWGDKIEVVIPFWLLYIDNGEQTVKSIKSYTSKYIIMAYRTNYTQIYNISAEWLTWGDKNEQKIIIALENGLIEDEVDKFNISSRINDKIEKFAFNDNNVILPNKDNSIGDNEVHTYSSHLSPRTANNEISFMGDEKRLFETVRLLQNDLTQWRSFDGIALHGLDL
ncbi:hypothetical protein B6D12_05690 [Gilliamella apicola]|uniref:hypothetical protein n=1 Tax=Gilliamella apicola TaxID=1196095 RepID=UPI000A33EB4B|nr:hypothetical protein [Gilliamella apicola]OTP89105.1 hypothetical protein B5S41_07600 [Gilliamella apicola]OTP96109.1 hypothetical protein B6D13_01120 [Gilliamella apicola]OTP96682.1 hypothetical protein B6D05_04225 [Gilliamella apicola]OTQ01960.1 hypothetical protein B6D07_07275 [Gilliamella apicola]OTQ05817.1 hypothetical protein B6D12_05690 [Gilliamella apicola]